MLWTVKNNIQINWPHYIMQHMIKCKDNNISLSNGATVLKKKTMKKLNIHQVHGVCQHERDDQEDDEDEEDDVDLAIQEGTCS